MSIRSRINSVVLTLALVVVGAVVAVATAAPASAASRDGVCNSGEFCYFFNSGEAGSVSDFTDSQEDYGTTQPSCYEFKGAGLGKGVCVKNQASSVWNKTSKTVRATSIANYNRRRRPGARRTGRTANCRPASWSSG
jgi:hypothetical protein